MRQRAWFSHVEVRQSDDDAQRKNQQMQGQKDEQPIGKYLETPLAPARLVKSSNIVVVRFSDL